MWFVKRRRAQNPDDYETWQQGGVSPTLNAFDNTGDSRATVIIFSASFKPGASAEARSIGYEEEMSPTLEGGGGGNNKPAVLVLAYDPGVIGPLTATGMTRARGTESVESNHVLCFTAQRVGEPPRIYEDITPSLLSRMGTGGNNTPMIAMPEEPIAFTTEQTPKYNQDVALTLTKGSPTGGGQPQSVAQPVTACDGDTNMVVRRLTPIECERLMGWPDNHTLHRADGKTNSDSTRYKMCGNGVATPVAQWIAEQLKELL